jgi:putative phosphoesterase
MRVLVISDTHGYLAAARRVIKERGPWDHIIHLGDSALDAITLAAELQIDILAVPGNNEHAPWTGHHQELLFDLHGLRFLALHGHELDLNPWDSSLEKKLAHLARRGRNQNATVVLFGHTHVPLIRRIDDVLLVNPGAMGAGDQRKTYAGLVISPPPQPVAAIEEV